MSGADNRRRRGGRVADAQLVPGMTRLFDKLQLPGWGCLLLSAQPASQGPLVQAVAAYRAAGARLVVTLLPEAEVLSLGLQALGTACTVEAMTWAHCPIDDFAAPGSRFERKWTSVGPLVHALLDEGEGVALHCRAGLGRTGTVAARILIERGLPWRQAMASVREARPGAIETSSQEAYLAQLTMADGVKTR